MSARKKPRHKVDGFRLEGLGDPWSLESRMRDLVAASLMPVLLEQFLTGGSWDDYTDLAGSAFNAADDFMAVRAQRGGSR